MNNEEQMPGNLLDEYLSLHEKNLEELRVRLNRLEKECSELRRINQSIMAQLGLSIANSNTIFPHLQDEIITSSPARTSLSIHRVDIPSLRQEKGVSNADDVESEYKSFYACPIVQGDNINLIDIGDNVSDALFLVRYRGDMGIVSYNTDNKLSLLNNVEVELLKYVTCTMETKGAPTKIEMILQGTAFCEGGIWRIKDKVKIKIS